ncbi:MAG: hypothetical protein ACR2N9_08770 [Acidimicrobiia bacterium]
MRLTFTLAALMLVLSACSSTTGGTVDDARTTSTQAPAATSTSAPDSDGCAHVIDAVVEPQGNGVYRVSATVESQETGWDKYADRWEIRDPATGVVVGERLLAHPHVDEQPFTRSLGGVLIPAAVTTVEIAAHDSVLGFCGTVHTAEVPTS